MTTAYLYSGNHFVRTQETQNGVWIRMNAPTDKELHALASALKLKIEQMTEGAAAATIGDKKYRLILSEQRIITISDSALEALEVEEDEELAVFVKTVMAVTFPDYFVNIDPCDVLPIVNGADCHVVSFALETEDIPGQLAAKLPEDLADAKGIIAVFCTSAQSAAELEAGVQSRIGKAASFAWVNPLSLAQEANVSLILAK